MTADSLRAERGAVVITGAGGGLGRAITHRLLSDGLRCVVTDQSEEGLHTTISQSPGYRSQVLASPGDLTNADDRTHLLDAAVHENGTLFGLVHCAGVAIAEPLFDESAENWEKTLGINLNAAFFLAQQALDHMRRNGGGRIVFITSVYGFMGFNNNGYGDRAPEVTAGDRGPVRQSAYAASKGGLIQLTRDLAAAAGRWGVTVNAVSPGSIPHGSAADAVPSGRDLPPAVGQKPARPGLGDRVDPEVLAALAAQVPLGRLGRAEEVAGPVSFLLSEDASYVTGLNLVVDGGWSIW